VKLAPLRPLAQALLPEKWLNRIQALRSRSQQVRLLKQLGLLEYARDYVQKNGTLVRNGPFAGMIYSERAAVSRHSIPKLLGTYELELHGVLQTAMQRRYECVVDIGSAEGYYAVGLAKHLKIPIYAYDPEPFEKSLCEDMARVNGVSNLVKMGSFFTKPEMESFLDRRVLLICDCEGYEAKLFDAASIASTAKWDLLIELHGSTQESLPQLPWPQMTQVISAEPRMNLPHYPEIDGIGPPEILLSEFRCEHQYWLWCDSGQPS
jgi:hypothetical protein